MGVVKLNSFSGHVQKRAKERYGLELTEKKYKYFLKLLKKRKTKLIKKSRKNREVHLLENKYVIVYSRQDNSIITFLS